MKKLLLYLIQKFDLIYSIRIVNIENKLYLSKNWKKYNELNIDHKDNNIIKEFNKNGFYNFGKVFSNQECQNFIENLNNKEFYSSQQPLQSDGKK